MQVTVFVVRYLYLLLGRIYIFFASRLETIDIFGYSMNDKANISLLLLLNYSMNFIHIPS